MEMMRISEHRSRALAFIYDVILDQLNKNNECNTEQKVNNQIMGLNIRLGVSLGLTLSKNPSQVDNFYVTF